MDDQEFADSKGAAAPGGNSYGGQYNGGYNNGNSGYNGGGNSYGGGNGYGGEQKPTPQSASTEGFMNIPDGVEDEGLPFN